MKSQSDNFHFFLENHDRLFSEYPDKMLVIQDNKVVFAEDTFDEALEKALKAGLVPGTFLIQECTEGEESYTQSFSSRVVFA